MCRSVPLRDRSKRPGCKAREEGTRGALRTCAAGEHDEAQRSRLAVFIDLLVGVFPEKVHPRLPRPHRRFQREQVRHLIPQADRLVVLSPAELLLERDVHVGLMYFLTRNSVAVSPSASCRWDTSTTSRLSSLVRVVLRSDDAAVPVMRSRTVSVNCPCCPALGVGVPKRAIAMISDFRRAASKPDRSSDSAAFLRP